MTVEYTPEILASLRHTLTDIVRDLTDPAYQRAVWVEARIEGVVGCFEETVAMLFDEYNVEDLAAGRLWGDRLTELQRASLGDLAKTLDMFLEVVPDIFDNEAVISHKGWPAVVAVVAVAKRALDALTQDA